MAELALNLSESLVLPFDAVNYGKFLQRELEKIETRYGGIVVTNGATFGLFNKPVNTLHNV